MGAGAVLLKELGTGATVTLVVLFMLCQLPALFGLFWVLKWALSLNHEQAERQLAAAREQTDKVTEALLLNRDVIARLDSRLSAYLDSLSDAPKRRGT